VIFLLQGMIFFLLGQFKFPELLLVLKIPTIQIEGEKNYYFMLRSFVNFVLNVLEYLKVPSLMLLSFFLIDDFITRNLLLIIFLLSASFPWSNRFKLQDPSFYSISIGVFFNIFTLIAIPILWILFKAFLDDSNKTALGIVSLIFVFSLYTVYFPVAIIALILQLILFTRQQNSQINEQ